MKTESGPAMDILASVFEAARKSPKTYEELVSDGGAMQRLLLNSDFKAYERLLAEALVLLVRRIGLAQRDDLPTIQGAIIQHQLISGLPTKVVETAARLVDSHRETEEKNAG